MAWLFCSLRSCDRSSLLLFFPFPGQVPFFSAFDRVFFWGGAGAFLEKFRPLPSLPFPPYARRGAHPVRGSFFSGDTSSGAHTIRVFMGIAMAFPIDPFFPPGYGP